MGTTSKPKNSISETTAAETLARFFRFTPDDDYVSIEDIYKAAERDSLSDETNKNWLNAKTNQLKHHNLIRSVKEFDRASRRHKVVGYRLTLAGKKAIGRVGVDDEDPDGGYDVNSVTASLDDVARAVEAFQKNNPNFEVIFDVKFKGVQPGK